MKYSRGSIFACPYCEEPMLTNWGWYNVYLECIEDGCMNPEAVLEIENPDSFFKPVKKDKKYKLKGLD